MKKDGKVKTEKRTRKTVEGVSIGTSGKNIVITQEAYEGLTALAKKEGRKFWSVSSEIILLGLKHYKR